MPKKLALISATLLALMFSLSSCLSLGLRKEPTETPLPPATATAVAVPPTSTPMPPPPTATLTPTAAPTETATPLPPTATDTPAPPMAKVTADLLNLRSEPTTDSDILDQILLNTMLVAVGKSQDGEWVLVSMSDGKMGWVSAEWVELTVPIDALPLGEAETPTPTPLPPTETPTPQPTSDDSSRPTPEPTPTLLPAPVLLEPANEQTFDRRGPARLAWTWDGRLTSEQFFVVTITYPHEGEAWRDIHWVKETSFPPPAYLPDLITNDRRCEWQVVIMRQTGTSEDGMKVGEPVSRPSGSRVFVWSD